MQHKTLTAVSTVDTEAKVVRRIFEGWPMASKLTNLILLRRITILSFNNLLADPEFANTFAESIRELAGQVIQRELKQNLRLLKVDQEDLVEDLVEHILRAVSKFDPLRGISLTSYINKFLARSKKFIKKAIKIRYHEIVESDLEPPDDGEEDKTPFEICNFEICDDEDPEKVAIAQDLKQKILNRFPSRQQRSKEIAEQMLDHLGDSAGKVQRCRVRRVLQEIFMKLERGPKN